MQPRRSWLMTLTLMGAATISAACSKESERPPAPVQPVAAPVMQAPMAVPVALPPIPPGVRMVSIADRDYVCMVNDQYMGRPQIPVVVDSRTYFGCCKMCKERLENDARLRAAVDPVSGRPVDKATASIGMLASGDVLYFETDESLRAYASDSR